MNKHAIALSALALLATAPAFANQQLAQQKNCMSCHAVDKKIVGPAYKDVAAKYKNDPKAEAMLVQKVMKGGGRCLGSGADAGQQHQRSRCQDAGEVGDVPEVILPGMTAGPGRTRPGLPTTAQPLLHRAVLTIHRR